MIDINDLREIIERYQTKPFASFLILGLNIKGQYIHVVCATKEKSIHFITAYVPDKNKWSDDLKTRKGL